MSTYILIVVSLTSWVSNSYRAASTSVVMQEFSSIQACRYAANEISRQNHAHSTLRMSCVPKGNP